MASPSFTDQLTVPQTANSPMISRALASALVALSCVPRTCLHLLSVIDEQLRMSRVEFSYLLFNNASLFGRFHGCYLPRYLFVG